MSQSTKNQLKGAFHEVKGKAKETVGQLSNSPVLVAKGKGEKLVGKLQQKVAKVQRALGK